MSKRRLLLGVDGGNTKTDLFLFWEDASLAADLRVDSVSHEVLGSYHEAGRQLAKAIDRVCEKGGVARKEIDCAVMGLAGVDIEEQRAAMDDQVAAMGIATRIICNDAVIGIKAAAPGGVGICSICGTGSVTVGVDQSGAVYQVGGVGGISGDYAGGRYLAEEACRAVYNEFCRDAPHTAMRDEVSKLLGITGLDDILDRIHYSKVDLQPIEQRLCSLLCTSAENGDAVAQEILGRMARFLASSVAGCYKALHFDKGAPLVAVLAGSVWAKCEYSGFYRLFREALETRVGVPVEMIVLKEPPALGAVLWTLECLDGVRPSGVMREKVLSAIQQARM